MSGLQRIALVWVLGVLVLVAVHIVLPQRSGPIALTEVFEPYLLLTALFAVALAARSRMPSTTTVAVVLVVVSVGRCAPGMVSPATPSMGYQLRLVSWNMLSDSRAPERAVAGLRGIEADLVGVQELLPDAAAAISADESLLRQLPYRLMAPERTVLGIGLMSRYYILEQQSWLEPPLMRVVIAAPGGPITVFVAHPLPARIRTVALLPVALETEARDASIKFIRDRVDEELAAGRSVILFGDFNVTEREPAYADLAAGLLDAHAETGWGPGLTWRPPSARALPIGLLRIDYVFSSPDWRPVAMSGDCSVPSDHCRIEVTLDREIIAQPLGH